VWTKLYWQQNEPTFSNITISSDTFSIVTYAIANNTTMKIDSYTIVKNAPTSILPTANKIRQLGPLTARLFEGSLLVAGLEGTARLEIFNVSGARVLDLGRRVFNGSLQEVTLARSLRSGIYLLRIAGSRNDNVRLIQP
jgi:hypothetical protein